MLNRANAEHQAMLNEINGRYRNKTMLYNYMVGRSVSGRPLFDQVFFSLSFCREKVTAPCISCNNFLQARRSYRRRGMPHETTGSPTGPNSQ